MRKLIDKLLRNYFKGIKIKILKEFNKQDYEVNKLNVLAKKLGISMPLLCYHINGNLKSDGLKDANCLIKEKINRVNFLRINDNGKIILEKYGDLK